MTAVLLDVGGVLVLPDFTPVVAVLQSDGRSMPKGMLDQAHYVAVGSLDEAYGTATKELVDAYVAGFREALGYGKERTDLSAAIETAFTSSWTRIVETSIDAMRQLDRLGHPIAVVSNSMGKVEEIARYLSGWGWAGATVEVVIDSFNAGVEKPDPRIFELALEAIGGASDDALHVGDSVVYDVRGAEAAGITALHFDPWDCCAVADHEHVRSLMEVASLLEAE
jgi:putative hydrolase of the HAD superfamily